jgi:hypothetical protein
MLTGHLHLVLRHRIRGVLLPSLHNIQISAYVQSDILCLILTWSLTCFDVGLDAGKYRKKKSYVRIFKNHVMRRTTVGNGEGL